MTSFFTSRAFCSVNNIWPVSFNLQLQNSATHSTYKMATATIADGIKLLKPHVYRRTVG